MGIKPKLFSEVYQNDSAALADALAKVTNHELFVCGKCNEPIHMNMRNSLPSWSGGIKFCTKCGTEIDWSDRYAKFWKSCPKCHTPHEAEDLFCITCGVELGQAIKRYS